MGNKQHSCYLSSVFDFLNECITPITRWHAAIASSSFSINAATLWCSDACASSPIPRFAC